MPESTGEVRDSVPKLLILAGIIGIGYACISAFRFSVDALNSIFLYAYFLVPFLAIRPTLRLPQRFKTLGLVLLTPLLVFSSVSLLMRLVGGRLERSQQLQSFQQGSSTVQLIRFSNGGALGVRGVYVEQRRLAVPELYLVRSIAFFDHAKEASLSVEGPSGVRVRARGNYYENDFVVDKVYSLKPWVYF